MSRMADAITTVVDQMAYVESERSGADEEAAYARLFEWFMGLGSGDLEEFDRVADERIRWAIDAGIDDERAGMMADGLFLGRAWIAGTADDFRAALERCGLAW